MPDYDDLKEPPPLPPDPRIEAQKKAEEEAAAKRRAEAEAAEAKRRADEEAAKRRKAEEEAARHRAEAEAIRKAQQQAQADAPQSYSTPASSSPSYSAPSYSAPASTPTSSSYSSPSYSYSSSSDKPGHIVPAIIFGAIFAIFLGTFLLWIVQRIFPGMSGFWSVFTWLAFAAGVFFFIFKAWRSKPKIMIIITSVIAVIVTVVLIAANTTKKENQKEEAELVNTAVVKEDLNLRSEPSGNSQILKILPEGSVIIIIGEPSGIWIPAEHNGTKGWVSVNFIESVKKK